MGNDNMEKIAAMTLRRNLGECLNKVKYQNEILIIERNGKACAAIVSLEKLDLVQEEARKEIQSSLAGGKKPDSLQGSIEILGDLEEGSKEIAKQFEKSIEDTAKKL